jgi:hypothetical protein
MTTTVLTKTGWYNKIMHGIGNDSTAADTTDSYEIQAKKRKENYLHVPSRENGPHICQLCFSSSWQSRKPKIEKMRKQASL